MAQIKSELQERFHIITCPERMNDAVCDQAEVLLADWVKMDVDVHALNFSNVIELFPKAYRVFVRLKQALRGTHRTLVTYGARDAILQQLHFDGMNGVFSPAATLEAAVKKIAKQAPKPKLNAEFVQAFIRAAKETFEGQAKTPFTAGPLRLKSAEGYPDAHIVAVLNLDSTTIQGTLTLCFSKKTFLEVYSNMFGEPALEISRDMHDAAAELLNILFGLAKRNLNDTQGFSLKKAIPTVFAGEGLVVPKRGNTSTAIVLPCQTQQGEFYLEILIEPAAIQRP